MVTAQMKQNKLILFEYKYHRPIFSSPFAIDFPSPFGHSTPFHSASAILSHPEPRQAENGETVTKIPAQKKATGHPMKIKRTFGVKIQNSQVERNEKHFNNSYTDKGP